jgi:hypothetical protein
VGQLLLVKEKTAASKQQDDRDDSYVRKQEALRWMGSTRTLGKTQRRLRLKPEANASSLFKRRHSSGVWKSPMMGRVGRFLRVFQENKADTETLAQLVRGLETRLPELIKAG